MLSDKSHDWKHKLWTQAAEIWITTAQIILILPCTLVSFWLVSCFLRCILHALILHLGSHHSINNGRISKCLFCLYSENQLVNYFLSGKAQFQTTLCQTAGGFLLSGILPYRQVNSWGYSSFLVIILKTCLFVIIYKHYVCLLETAEVFADIGE